MLYAYEIDGNGLRQRPHEAPPDGAQWIDLFRPMPPEVAAVEALGLHVPTLEEMEEIELSNRLYRHGDTETMIVSLPGTGPEGGRVQHPVAFIIAPDRLLTVRYHAPRPFETFPGQADTTAAGCTSPDRIFLGLVEAIVGRIADLLEASDRGLESAGREIFSSEAINHQPSLRNVLDRIAVEAETLSRVRLSLMTLERALTYFTVRVARTRDDDGLNDLVKAKMRDMAALTEHSDFVAARMGQISDATLGIISLAQNATVRLLSVVAALFLPPTLIASIYGMNFTHMPELARPYAYPLALLAMAVSALVTFLYFKWKKWL